MTKLDEMLEVLQEYRAIRLKLLKLLGCANSNRDPLAELSERLVAEQVGGYLASSRVQKGYDVIDPENIKIQVKYLANPEGNWVNGHEVRFTSDMDPYAVVFFENLEPRATIIFSKSHLTDICKALGKRHPNQDSTLQLTPAKVRSMLKKPDQFERLGVKVILIPPANMASLSAIPAP